MFLRLRFDFFLFLTCLFEHSSVRFAFDSVNLQGSLINETNLYKFINETISNLTSTQLQTSTLGELLDLSINSNQTLISSNSTSPPSSNISSDARMNITVSKNTFVSHIRAISNLSFRVYPEICASFRKKLDICKRITGRDPKARAIKDSIEVQAEVFQSFCHSSISALSGWRIESCVFNLRTPLFDPISKPGYGSFYSCITLYRCFLFPHQSFNASDPWNTSVPLNALGKPIQPNSNGSSFGGTSLGIKGTSFA